MFESEPHVRSRVATPFLVNLQECLYFGNGVVKLDVLERMLTVHWGH